MQFNPFTTPNANSGKNFDLATSLQDPKVLGGIAAVLLISAYLMSKGK
jgi:hypothetical protein